MTNDTERGARTVCQTYNIMCHITRNCMCNIQIIDIPYIESSERWCGRLGFCCDTVSRKLRSKNIYIVSELLKTFSKETVHKTVEDYLDEHYLNFELLCSAVSWAQQLQWAQQCWAYAELIALSAVMAYAPCQPPLNETFLIWCWANFQNVIAVWNLDVALYKRAGAYSRNTCWYQRDFP